MTSPILVPDLNQATSLYLQGLSGWRKQEDWGRWMLGHQSDLIFSSTQKQLVVLETKLYLPYKGQKVEILMNDRRLFSFTNERHKTMEFPTRLLLNIQPGRNSVSILTNVSNRDGRQPPFAASDPADLSIAIKGLKFRHPQASDQGWFGAVPSEYIGNTYTAFGSSGATLLLQGKSSGILKYSLFRKDANQAFQILLNEKEVASLTGHPSTQILRGETPLTGDPGSWLQLTFKSTVASIHTPLQGYRPTESSSVLFYAERFKYISTPAAWQDVGALVLAVLGVSLMLAVLGFLFFRRRAT